MRHNTPGIQGYVVVAEFLVIDDQREAFIGLMQKHAALSRAEPGCFVFEVNQDIEDGAKFLLFECYENEAAYWAHRATAHYALFRQDAPSMLQPNDGDIFHRRTVFRSVTIGSSDK